MKKPNPRIELAMWLIVIYVCWIFLSSCNAKLSPRSYFKNVKRGCIETTFRGFVRTDTLIEGCDCKQLTFKK